MYISGTVFDLISKEDKQKMENAKKMTSKPINIEQRQSDSIKESSYQSNSDSAVTQTSIQPVQQVQSQEPSRIQPSQKPAFTSIEEQRRMNVPLFQSGAGFKPFVKDPGKQERYDKYLALVKQGHTGEVHIFFLNLLVSLFFLFSTKT